MQAMFIRHAHQRKKIVTVFESEIENRPCRRPSNH
jgi:hypothetical protein